VHCSSAQIVAGARRTAFRATASGLQRTFNILTNTPFMRLRNKERWLTYVAPMFEDGAFAGARPPAR